MADPPIYPSFHPATLRQDLSFEERALIARDAGFRATALDVSGACAFDQVNGSGAAKRLLRHCGLEPSGWGGGPSLFSTEGDFENGLRDLAGKAAFAADLGALHCATFLPNRSDQPQHESHKLVEQRLNAIAEVLASHGFKLGIEFCGPQMFKDRKWAFVTGVTATMELVQDSGAENIGVLADSFHLFCSRSQPEDLPSVAKGRITGVHINDAPDQNISTLLDADRIMPGDGVIPLNRFLTCLEQSGYQGPAEVELFNPKYRTCDPLTAAIEAREKAELTIRDAFS